MCFGGGGGGGTQEVKQTTSNLPEYAEPYYKDMLARAGYESALPYEAYQGSRLQYFNPAEQEAMTRMTEMGTSGTPDELDAAGRISALVGKGNPYADSMMQGTQNAQGALVGETYQPGSLADQASTSRYMSPYQQQVVDVQKREAARQSDIRGADIGLEAAGQGSLGGYREAIMQSERERNLGQQMGDIQTRGSQDAFESAQQAFEADRSANFGARQMYNQSNIDAARMGQDTYGQLLQGGAQQLQAAGQMGGFVDQRQQMEYERLRNMQAAGQNERQLNQQGLDIGYQDFLRQQGYGKEQLGFYNNILQGAPFTPGQTTQTYGGGPSDWQQALGSGVAGVGLYNAYK